MIECVKINYNENILTLPIMYPFIISSDEFKYNKYTIKYTYNYMKLNDNLNYYFLDLLIMINNIFITIIISISENELIVYNFFTHDRFNKIKKLYIQLSNNMLIDINNILNTLFKENFLSNEIIEQCYNSFINEGTTCDSVKRLDTQIYKPIVDIKNESKQLYEQIYTQLDKQIYDLLQNDPDNDKYVNKINYFSHASGNLQADIKLLLKLKKKYTFDNLLFNDIIYNRTYSILFLEHFLRQQLNLNYKYNIYFTNSILCAEYIANNNNIKFNYCISIQPQGYKVDKQFQNFYKIYCDNSYKIIWCDEKKQNILVPKENVNSTIHMERIKIKIKIDNINEFIKNNNYILSDITKIVSLNDKKELSKINMGIRIKINYNELKEKYKNNISIKSNNVITIIIKKNIIQLLLLNNYPFKAPIIIINDLVHNINNWNVSSNLINIIENLIK